MSEWVGGWVGEGVSVCGSVGCVTIIISKLQASPFVVTSCLCGWRPNLFTSCVIVSLYFYSVYKIKLHSR